MKTALFRILIAFTIVTVGSDEMKSQQLPDSLSRYLGIAAEKNPAVQQKLFEYQAALQKVPQAGSLPDPQLISGFFLKPMELMSGNQVADFELMQMFPWFGVLRNAKDEMSLMANAKYEQFRDARAQLYYDVQRTWYELFRIRAGRRISEKNISLLRTIERLTLVKYKSPSMGSITRQQPAAAMSEISSGGTPGGSPGMQDMSGKTSGRPMPSRAGNEADMPSSSMGPSSGGSGLSDLYRVQIEILGLEDRIESLKTLERTLTVQMNSLLNRPPLSPVYVDTVLLSYSLPFPDEALRDSIMANNPMLTMLDYENKSLEAKKKMAEGMSYPMVGIGLSYSIVNRSAMSTSSMNGDDMVMPMLSVTLPVYRKKYKAIKNEVHLLQASTEQAYLETVNSLTTEFYSALQMFQDASRKTRLYENQGKLASGSLDLILKDFSTSVTPLTDVLRMQQEVYEYDLKLIEANADLNIAVAWIARLIGSDNKQ